MKIYIERKINSADDLPKEPGFYYIHYKHPNDRVHTQMSVVYYDETIKGLWFGKDWYDYWLDPIEVSEQEYAAIQVAKALDKPTDEEIEEWAREQFMPKKDYSHLTEVQEAILICFKSGCSYGAKAALNGEIKKNEK